MFRWAFRARWLAIAVALGLTGLSDSAFAQTSTDDPATTLGGATAPIPGGFGNAGAGFGGPATGTPSDATGAPSEGQPATEDDAVGDGASEAAEGEEQQAPDAAAEVEKDAAEAAALEAAAEPEALRRFQTASSHGFPALVEDQPVKIVGNVGQQQFGLGPGPD